MNPDTRRYAMSAIDRHIEQTMPKPVEVERSGKDLVQWGEDNGYPDFLLALYENVPTLQSIINGTRDFVKGDGMTIAPLRDDLNPNVMNNKGDIIDDQVERLALDYLMYGAFALQVIRGKDGSISEVHYINVRYLRMNKEGDVFYYSEKWNKPGLKKTIEYPAFMRDINWNELDDEQKANVASSVLYVKRDDLHTYPSPIYGAAVKSCEMERRIDDFHLNDLDNHFTASAIINLCNGIPDEPEQSEIEKNLNEKTAGYQNGGRIVITYSDGRINAPVITPLNMEDFGERYDRLAERAQQSIFTAFRANPNLFGIPTEGNGFANEQYEESFKLYNRTMVRPIQRKICDAYDKIYGRIGVLQISPFSLAAETENIVR